MACSVVLLMAFVHDSRQSVFRASCVKRSPIQKWSDRAGVCVSFGRGKRQAEGSSRGAF